MTTTTRPLSRFRALLRLKKSKADDNIERHEPDRFIPIAQDFFFGIVFTACFMMLAYAFMNGSMAEWIGNFIAHNAAGSFDERFSAFTAACIALVSMVVIFGVALTREASNDDIVEVTNDQSDEINERFAELENRIAGQLDEIRAAVEDLTPGTGDNDEIHEVQLEERIGLK